MNKNKKALEALLALSDKSLLHFGIDGIVKHRKVAESYVKGFEIQVRLNAENRWVNSVDPQFYSFKSYKVKFNRKVYSETVFAPIRGQLFYYCGGADVVNATWVGTDEDLKLLYNGNCFQTREEAERVLARIWTNAER
jgi:hypothetical protein